MKIYKVWSSNLGGMEIDHGHYLYRHQAEKMRKNLATYTGREFSIREIPIDCDRGDSEVPPINPIDDFCQEAR